MDNYVHMAAKVEVEKLSAAFKRLNIKYTMYYNKIHNTIGHVFQDRFKSVPTKTEEYLLMVIRYIHNNSVQAKMLNELLEDLIEDSNLSLRTIAKLIEKSEGWSKRTVTDDFA